MYLLWLYFLINPEGGEEKGAAMMEVVTIEWRSFFGVLLAAVQNGGIGAEEQNGVDY